MKDGMFGEMRYPDSPRINVEEAGNIFEDCVCDTLSHMGLFLRTYKSKKYQFSTGENNIGWEIKLDEGCLKYNHLSIEVAEKSRNDINLRWTPSGIMRNDNAWLYIQGNTDCFWIFNKKTLVHYFEDINPVTTEKFGTIRTFYLEFADADRLGYKIVVNKQPELL